MDEKAERPLSRKRVLLLELAAVSGVCYLPALTLSIYSFGSNTEYLFLSLFDFRTALYDLLTHIGFPFLLWFTIWASGDSTKKFGLAGWKWGKDIPVILCLAGLAILISNMLYRSYAETSWLPDAFREHLGFRYALVALCFTLLGFWEEFFYRGYLIPRLEEITGKTTIALALSSLLFGLVHVYQGWIGAGSAAIFGLAFGIAFILRRSIWPLAIAHAIYNFYIVCMTFR